MQATNVAYQINRTSLLDQWMISDESNVIVQNETLGSLAQIKTDWNARYLLALSLYLNSINGLTDEEADAIISQTFAGGAEVGQRLMSPHLHQIYPDMESGKIPDQIRFRLLNYMFAIHWSVATPYPEYEMTPLPEMGPEEKIIRVVSFEDGDFDFMIGSDRADLDKTSHISGEIGNFIKPAFADVDGMYFSSKESALNAAHFVHKYFRDRYDYDFAIVNNE